MMASKLSAKRNPNVQFLDDLEALNQTLNVKSAKRTTSLGLPRNPVPLASFDDSSSDGRPVRRASMSPWINQSNIGGSVDEKSKEEERKTMKAEGRFSDFMSPLDAPERKGIWKWKPIRALSRIGKQRVSCLFSVEVIAVQGLPSSMNGLRLSVCVRKKETRDGAVHTMPSRVSNGAADFDEMLFFRCNVYCTQGESKSNKQLSFESRPFWIYAFAIDAGELDFGRSSVDLSRLIQESIAKSQQGTRVRQWDASFNLAGKAQGGELVIKLGFQIMEEGGVDIYTQSKDFRSGKTSSARAHSKSSFSVPSPRMINGHVSWTPTQAKTVADIPGMDDLNLDDPSPVRTLQSSVPKFVEKGDDFEIPYFEIVDKGVEIQGVKPATEESEQNVEQKSISSEVVKEIVHDPLRYTRLTELDSIAQQIKALENMVGDEKNLVTRESEIGSLRILAAEEKVTKEFLQMLEHEEDDEFKFSHSAIRLLQLHGEDDNASVKPCDYISDLGKSLGSVIQTKNGGYLAALDPFDAIVERKDTPKLAMQLSKPIIVPLFGSKSGFEVFQTMSGLGIEELTSQVLSLMPIDELMGKPAEQIAYEGIASAIIQGRNKEGATSRAARSIAATKTMCAAMSTGRQERITSGIWNVTDKPVVLEEILAFSLQKIEAMAMEALKIQADLTEELAPFEVPPPTERAPSPLSSAVSIDDCMKIISEGGSGSIAMIVVIQLRDPIRNYEAVGAPMLTLITANKADDKKSLYNEPIMFRVNSLHVGGIKLRSGDTRSIWDSDKQKLTAIQWLIAYGFSKGGRRRKPDHAQRKDILWTMSSRIVADMWLKSYRNPNLEFIKQERR